MSLHEPIQSVYEVDTQYNALLFFIFFFFFFFGFVTPSGQISLVVLCIHYLGPLKFNNQIERYDRSGPTRVVSSLFRPFWQNRIAICGFGNTCDRKLLRQKRMHVVCGRTFRRLYRGRQIRNPKRNRTIIYLSY